MGRAACAAAERLEALPDERRRIDFRRCLAQLVDPSSSVSQVARSRLHRRAKEFDQLVSKLVGRDGLDFMRPISQAAGGDDKARGIARNRRAEQANKAARQS